MTIGNNSIKQTICDLSKQLRSSGLSLAGGNVSSIHDGLIYITPSGVGIGSISADDISVIRLHDRTILAGTPSRELPIHRAIYESSGDHAFVIHTHSTYATALACRRASIPQFHFMVAIFGGSDVRCAGYAPLGSEELSLAVKEAMYNRKACLMANHGVIVAGRCAEEAIYLATEIEQLSKIYIISDGSHSRSILLTDEQMQHTYTILKL